MRQLQIILFGFLFLTSCKEPNAAQIDSESVRKTVAKEKKFYEILSDSDVNYLRNFHVVRLYKNGLAVAFAKGNGDAVGLIIVGRDGQKYRIKRGGDADYSYYFSKDDTLPKDYRQHFSNTRSDIIRARDLVWIYEFTRIFLVGQMSDNGRGRFFVTCGENGEDVGYIYQYDTTDGDLRQWSDMKEVAPNWFVRK